MSKSTTIRVLIVEPGKNPYPAEIPNTLESLQNRVGGLIQILYPFPISESCGILCHDEGKLIGLPQNRPLFDEDGFIYDVIAGTFPVVGLTEDDFGSLTEEQIELPIGTSVRITTGRICGNRRRCSDIRTDGSGRF